MSILLNLLRLSELRARSSLLILPSLSKLRVWSGVWCLLTDKALLNLLCLLIKSLLLSLKSLLVESLLIEII